MILMHPSTMSMMVFIFIVYVISQSNSGLATTVITLSDWYHGLATNLFPNPTNATPCVFKFLTGFPNINRTPTF